MNGSFLIFVPLLCFVPFFLAVMFGAFGRGSKCPECGTPLPCFFWPQTKTRRQWLEGGCNCPKCGIDVAANGRKVVIPWVASRARTLTLFAVLAVSNWSALFLANKLLHKN